MFTNRQDRILVIKAGSLGGFVAAEPVFEQIRAAHPGATISLLTVKPLERLARAAPYFDQVAAIANFQDKTTRKNLFAQIRRSRFSRVYDLSNNDISRRVMGCFGVMKPKCSVIPSARGQAARTPQANRIGDIERFCGVAGLPEPVRAPRFDWALETRKDSANMHPSWYGLTGPYGLLLPNADPARRMSAHAYAELANMLARGRITPVLIGGHDLNDFGDDISMHAPDVVDLTGKSDHLQLVSLARTAHFFISDHADEMLVALSVGLDGVLISDRDDKPLRDFCCHVVRLAANGADGAVKAGQVWQTVRNMGLADAGTDHFDPEPAPTRRPVSPGANTRRPQQSAQFEAGPNPGPARSQPMQPLRAGAGPTRAAQPGPGGEGTRQTTAPRPIGSIR